MNNLLPGSGDTDLKRYFEGTFDDLDLSFQRHISRTLGDRLLEANSALVELSAGEISRVMNAVAIELNIPVGYVKEMLIRDFPNLVDKFEYLGEIAEA